MRNKKYLAYLLWVVFLWGIVFVALQNNTPSAPLLPSQTGALQTDSGTTQSETKPTPEQVKNKYYVSKESSVNVERQLKAKRVLEASAQNLFTLSPSQGLHSPNDLPESVIDKLSALIAKMDKITNLKKATYTSLEEYLLLFAYKNAFTASGGLETFDEKKICTLPIKDSEVFLVIVDQFFANSTVTDAKKEQINQKIKEQIAFACGSLNVETQTGSLERYLSDALKNKSSLNEKTLRTLPQGNSSANYLVEKGFILLSPFAENVKLVNEWAVRRTEIGKTLGGKYKVIQLMNSPKWTEREYRMATIIDYLITGSPILENAKKEAENTKDATMAAIAKKAANLFQRVTVFKEADLEASIKRGEEIDAECEQLTAPTIRTCVANKSVLSYLYLYKQQYDKALALLKTAEDFPLMRAEKIAQGLKGEAAKWDVYRATSLGEVMAMAYFEKGDYTSAKKYLLKDVESRPIGRNTIDIKVTLDALAGKFDPVFTISK